MSCGSNANLQQCGTDLPSSFCCPQATICMRLNASGVQSVICCPAGSDCAFIQSITCDITQMNATLHPENQMHVSDTAGVILPTCGDKCCPLGYSCRSGMCAKAALGAAVSSAVSFATATSSAIVSSSPTAPTAPSSPRASVSSNVDVRVVTLGSALGGFFFLGLLALGFFLIRRYGLPLRRRKEGKEWRGEKIMSWNKPELEDTQPARKGMTAAELSAEREANELRASRDVSELPG
jgi:hypothetical protein